MVRSHVRAQTAWIAIMDLVCLGIGAATGVLLRFGHDEMREYVFGHVDGWIVLFGGVLLANYLAGSYRLQFTFSRFNLLVTWFFSLVFALFFLSVTSYAWFTVLLGRGVLLLSLLSYSALSLFLKLLVYRGLFRQEAFTCRTVIMGTGEWARAIRRMLENEYVLPSHKVVAFVRIDDGAGEAHAPVIDGVVVVDGRSGQIEEIVRSLGANLIVMDFGVGGGTSTLYKQVKKIRFEGVEVLSPLGVAEIYSGRTPLDIVNEELLMTASMESNFPLVRRIKRMFDLLASLAALVLCSPIGLLVALLVKASAPRSPVFYSQVRVGQFGREFRILKFRTMKEGAEKETGPVWSMEGDPRITRIGKLLRRFRLDEIPQFANVLKGDMSIVGPRPERPEFMAELAEKIPYYEERSNLVPGLTGWAQIQCPYVNNLRDAARKLEYDLYYMKHMSFSLDLQIILRTLRIVALGKERAT